MILEEAAGVSGLHSRRHEAELRLRAAETNLTRLDDVARELETGLGRLKREARAAERYRKLSAEIRALQSAVLCARWAEARAAAARLAEEASQAARAVEATARAAAQASAAALEADAGMAPLRETSTIAVAVLNKLAIDKDRLDRETEAHAAELARLAEDLARIETDQARETQIAEDAAAALLRLGADLQTVLAEIADAPARGPELEAAARAAETARAAADAEVERLAGVVASEEAGRNSATQRLEAAEARASRTRRALDEASALHWRYRPTTLPPSLGPVSRRPRWRSLPPAPPWKTLKTHGPRPPRVNRRRVRPHARLTNTSGG
jgi:chromosome segregation protein